MKDAAPTTIYLKDYTPFGYVIDSVALEFDLHPTATRVTSRIAFAPNPAAKDKRFFLHGEDLTLISAKIDGAEVTPRAVDGGIELDVPEGPFLWEAEVEISPESNTALEGLYMSGGMYCTQCEAEGFRKITYYPDRPDVMAVFTVRVRGDLPVLLSNGNPVRQEAGVAEWHDPWPKPAYLFALVAGDLINHPGQFATKSGKEVELNIWVRPGDEGKCAFGMQALKDSMRWDEEVYGREYDLDIFNIVAVDDFNMGAMENKGLNIFNSSCVLASPETSTDATFERVEAIIAHEYFHNWTGNRITCRDWFQLSLKEGLTVFRDQQFSADMRSAAVCRIDDVLQLRARQFREDGGPLAHQVQPDSFVEINNFYTATIYEKGAEIIRMLHTLVGQEAYDKALDLYFARHDGQACTIDDWLTVFEDSTGRDLAQFKRWYKQAGTPRLKVTDAYADGTYTLTFEQMTPATPGQPDKDPVVIPVALGLLAPSGEEVVATQVVEITEAKQSVSFDGLAAKPIPSLLRNFSAPVVLERGITTEERAFLLAHDTDPFNKWEAGRALAKEVLIALTLGKDAPLNRYCEALKPVLRDAALDPDFRALVLAVPSADDLAATLAELGVTPDPDAIWTASETLKQARAEALQDLLPRLLAEMEVTEPFAPTHAQAGKRSLYLGLMQIQTRLDGGKAAEALYARADNMTLKLGALGMLLNAGKGDAELAAFFAEFEGDALVIDKWFMLQAGAAAPEKAAEITARLTEHAEFHWKNPNRFRALIGAFSANHAGFHRANGAGYKLLADWLIKLDPVNPQITARMSGAFDSWRRYDGDRQSLIKDQLDRILRSENLSRDTQEMISRIRNG